MDFLLIFLLVLFLTPVDATPEVKYFISCGSSATTTLADSRMFVGDVKPSRASTFRLYTHPSETVENSTQLPVSTDVSLYTTARVFSKASAYEFNIPHTGVYILRFHFFAFSSSPSLSEAQFDVSASVHMLLPGFTVGKNGTDTKILKEFFIDINTTGKFRVHFVPNSVASTIAFVNAIELFSTKLKFKKYNVMEMIYRVNVGDREVNSSDDTLWRNWVRDDQYLVDKSEVVNTLVYQDEIQYGSVSGAATSDDAPNLVYETAKHLDSNNKNLNMTWKFNVSKEEVHLVRMHFCDIISVLGSYMMNVYINENFIERLDPNIITSEEDTGVPFYRDYTVRTGNSEFIVISLEPVNNTVYLNGLEIMLVKNGTALDPLDQDGSSHLRVIVAVVVSAIALIAILVVLLFLMKKKKRENVEESEWEMIHVYGVSSQNRSSERSSSHPGSNFQNLNLGLTIPFSYIQKVTNNFDANTIIGEGGFGKVYKAVFKDGLKVAVKRSSPDHGQGLSEFQTEIMVLSKIRHRHLVSLIGYCYEDNEMILVYEFMEKGTLRDHLYDSGGIAVSSNCLGLSWKQRLEICIGAAKGLHYLHTGSDGRIIHRDVKSTNILLDDHYVAKVADFGLSRLGHSDEQTHISTDVKGTFGYLDPEYYGCMQLTEKSDVYSFGVVLLEVLCARPVINRALPATQVNLANWGMTCLEQGKVEEIIDPSIAGEVTPNVLNKFMEATAKCLKESSIDRPPMSDVLWELEYALLLHKAATEGELPGDTRTLTDSTSLNLPVPSYDAFFASQSFSDVKDDDTITSTAQVFSQLKFDDGTIRLLK